MVNVISNRGYEGTYQKLGYVNGRTSWNSSSGCAVWHSQNNPYWLFGSMDVLGQDMGLLFAFIDGSSSCFYNISGDQWQYYNHGASAWTFVDVGDVSMQCLSGNLNQQFSKKKRPTRLSYLKNFLIFFPFCPNSILINLDNFR